MLLLIGGNLPALSAPPQLYNKTIRIAWSQANTLRDHNGRVRQSRNDIQNAIYISARGRIFNKSFVRAPGGTESWERGPEGRPAGAAAFEGNDIVSRRAWDGIAQEVRITFDPSFSTCSLSVRFGKTGEIQRWKGLDGMTYEVLAVTMGSTSCSISEGNAFAM